MNELLKEARDALDDELHGVHNGCLSDGMKRIAEKEALIARIDAALSTPEPDAMEILRQVREGCFVWDSDSGKLEIGSAMIGFDFTLPDTEATTLIDGIRRTGLDETELDAIKDAIDLLDKFTYEADEDSCMGMSFFKARLGEDGFFIVMSALEKILTAHGFTVEKE